MKTTLLLAIMVALILVVVAAFLLFETKSTPEETRWSKGVTQITEEGEKATEVTEGQRLYGGISEIGEDYIVVDTLKLEVNERTKIYDNSTEIRLSDLNDGDRIRVDYTDNFEAFRIYLQQGKE
jgi:uncharacterized protein YxeA